MSEIQYVDQPNLLYEAGNSFEFLWFFHFLFVFRVVGSGLLIELVLFVDIWAAYDERGIY